MILRLVRWADCHFLWDLANDRDVRDTAFNTGCISWQDHVTWFEERMGDQNTRMFIAESGRVPVGLVRFEIEGSLAKVSLYIVKEFRNKGYGSRVLTIARDLVPQRKVAFIKEWNAPSIHAFSKAGYRIKNHSVIHGEPVVVMESP